MDGDLQKAIQQIKGAEALLGFSDPKAIDETIMEVIRSLVASVGSLTEVVFFLERRLERHVTGGLPTASPDSTPSLS